MTSDKKLVYAVAEWLWENDTENLYIGFQSAYHWSNLAESARERWYTKAELMMSVTGIAEALEEAEAEINFYKSGAGRTPSPRDRRIVREALARSDER